MGKQLAAHLPAEPEWHSWMKFLRSPRSAVIYGAGRQASVVYDFCVLFGKPIFCLMTTDSRNRWGLLPPEEELPLHFVGGFSPGKDKSGYDVIVAVNATHNAVISAMLTHNGWPSITTVEDWETINAATREAFYSEYLEKRGARYSIDADGYRVVECPAKHGALRMYYDIDTVYKPNLLGNFNNIVLPTVFDDFSAITLYGPYEYENVALHSGDVVLALGANIGLFSCAAAAIGCKVYAFEPTPLTREKYLLRNAGLYPNFEVAPYALLDRTGTTDFYINADYAASHNLTRNSVFKDMEPSYSQIEVEVTTVDTYVAERKIERVDFIKSHIQWAEDIMFDGAVNTLRRFSPHLAFYSRGGPGSDWRRFIEEKIRSANPRYQFAYKWLRVFAWVPESER